MKFKNIVFFLTLNFLIFGCNDLKNRYDPIEASRNIFQMKEFVFYSSENSPPLDIDAWGKIDNDNYTVTVPFPPSESLTAAPLTARFWVENVGLNGGGDFDLSLNQYWNDSPTIKLDPKEFGYEYYEEPLYETEYDIIMEPKFTVELSYGSNSHFNAGSLSFNMMFNDDAAPAYLGQAAFIGGFGIGATNNFMSLGAGNFSPTMPSGGFNYSVFMTPVAEGPVTVQFAAGSVQETVSYKGNDLSNKLTFYYDITPPTTTGTISADKLDEVIMVVDDAQLSISFPQANDVYSTQSELSYQIHFSDTNSMTDLASTIGAGTLLYQGFSNYSYKPEYVFSYTDMVNSAFDSQLTPGVPNDIYFNVIVTDLAGNQNVYTQGTITYPG